MRWICKNGELRFALDNSTGAIIVSATIFGICGWLLYLVVCDYVVGALTDARISITAGAPPASFIAAPFTDDRVGVDPDILEAATRFFPNSALLHIRLGEFERYGPKHNWRAAEFHAMLAIQLSPHDYKPQLLLASLQDSQQDLQAAEESVRGALKLAPGNLEAHWLLGSVLLRRGKLAGSLEEFRAAGSGHEAYLHEALKVVWRASGKTVDAVRAITPDNPNAKLELARFLLEQSQPVESAAVFRQIDHDALPRYRESSHYLNSLIAVGQVRLARELWCGLLDRCDEAAEGSSNAIWNGGFESDILVDFAQFDWSIQPNNYARISIDSKTSHRGKRSLRIDFLGRETTRLEEEIKQLTLVRSGARYQLQYYVRTEGLAAPTAPRVVLSGTTSKDWIAASDPVPAGTIDWQQRTVEFTASGPALIIAIKQRPRYSYEDPTHGTVWYDDFEIREIR